MCSKKKKGHGGLKTERQRLGLKIRTARETLSIGQEELAHAMDMPVSLLHKYETGTRMVPIAELFRFATFLKVDLAWFFTEPGSRSARMRNASNEAQAIIKAFSRIKDPDTRRLLIELARSLNKKE